MASCDSNCNDSCVTWPKSPVTPHFDCLDVRNVVVSLTMLMGSCDANTSAKGMTWYKKSDVLHLNLLYLTNAMVPLTMQSASHAAYVNASDSTWPESHAALHFNHSDIRNWMLPVIMSLTLCDSDTSASGITWPSHTSFQLSRCEEWNDNIFNATNIMWCHHWCQWHHMYKESCFASFLSLWPNKCNGTIDNSIDTLKMCLDIVEI